MRNPSNLIRKKKAGFIILISLLVFFICFIPFGSNAQILQKLKDKLKEKQEQKENEIVDKSVDQLDWLGKSKNKSRADKTKTNVADEAASVIDTNDTPNGRARNRRVAFVKM